MVRPRWMTWPSARNLAMRTGRKKIDFEFDSGERFAWREGAGESDAHGSVGDVAKYCRHEWYPSD